ncbi:hypothetical protein OIO90_006247 [Microbotryomycetes sp. JL221]|nr:hypothetical protein OIO90_006247 [Microbotryomycetes sp. JL221]
MVSYEDGEQTEETLAPPRFGSSTGAALTIAQEFLDTPGKTFLFATPLNRTYAPFLHNTITRLAGVPRTYRKYESSDIPAFLELAKQPDFAGSAVSMPNKVAICEHLDELTEDGKNIGACNTVIVKKGPNGERILVGHNTDSVGVYESMRRADDSHIKSGKTRPGMIFGAGGASRAAVYALNKWMNCNPIYVANRDDGEVEALINDYKRNASDAFNPRMIHIKSPEEVKNLEAPAYIVSAVPAYPPVSDGEKNARAIITEILKKGQKGVLLENLAQIAQDLGWKVVDGVEPMAWQGIEQQKLWLNCEESDLNVEKVLEIVRKQSERFRLHRVPQAEMDSLDLSELHVFAATIAIKAGSYLRDEALARMSRTQASQFDSSIAIKENAADLVTQCDLNAERLISDAIRLAYPTHKIIGEESYSAGQDKRFLLDNPIGPDAPKGCLFTAEWGKARSDTPTSNLTKKVNTFWNMAAEVKGRGGKGGMVHGVRSLGSAALDLVYVATGAVDIFWECGCWEWDVCAGVCLINESGGRVVPAQPPAGLDTVGEIPDCDLGSRLYLAVRPCIGTEDETAAQAQDRLIRAVWRRCETLDYVRPT